MSCLDSILAANGAFAASFDPIKNARRKPKFVLLTCMDGRLNFPAIFGLEAGDFQIFRNGGAFATEDALRSLYASICVLGAPEAVVIAHTGCAFHGLTDRPPLVGFADPVEHVREQVAILRSQAWLPGGTGVHGLVYDVESGRLTQVD